MQRVINGKVLELPSSSDGSVDADTLYRLANVPRDRVLVLQRPNGQNVVVNRGDSVRVNPQDHVAVTHNGKRGC